MTSGNMRAHARKRQDPEPALGKKAPRARAEPGGSFPDITGIDSTEACKSMGGNLALFDTLLSILLDQYEDAVDAVSALMTAGKQTEAAERLHTLLGVFRNIHATEIANMLQQIQESLHNARDQDAKDLLPTLKKASEKLFLSIRKRNEWRAAHVMSHPINLEPGQSEYLDLLKLLEERNMAAFEHFSKMRPVLEIRYGHDVVDKINKAITNLHFDEATTLLLQMTRDK